MSDPVITITSHSTKQYLGLANFCGGEYHIFADDGSGEMLSKQASIESLKVIQLLFDTQRASSLQSKITAATDPIEFDGEGFHIGDETIAFNENVPNPLRCIVSKLTIPLCDQNLITTFPLIERAKSKALQGTISYLNDPSSPLPVYLDHVALRDVINAKTDLEKYTIIKNHFCPDPIDENLRTKYLEIHGDRIEAEIEAYILAKLRSKDQSSLKHFGIDELPKIPKSDPTKDYVDNMLAYKEGLRYSYKTHHIFMAACNALQLEE